MENNTKDSKFSKLIKDFRISYASIKDSLGNFHLKTLLFSLLLTFIVLVIPLLIGLEMLIISSVFCVVFVGLTLTGSVWLYFLFFIKIGTCYVESKIKYREKFILLFSILYSGCLFLVTIIALFLVIFL